MTSACENVGVCPEDTGPADRLARQPRPAPALTLMAAAFGLSRGNAREEDER